MADGDVDDILQKFFSTIAEKDADAFKLYEDNKRMRDLVQQTLHAREELEERHRATHVLVESLQTALKEKEQLIGAQDSENAAWRDGIAELRAVLDRPSELDFGLRDVVDDVRDMAAELRSLRHGLQYAQWCCDGWEEHTLNAMMHAEARERALLEDAEQLVREALLRAAVDAAELRKRAEVCGLASASAVQRWESWYAQVEGERDSLVEAHERALQLADLEVQKQQRRADTLQEKVTALKASINDEGIRVDHARQRHSLEQESSSQLLALLRERCFHAESAWLSAVRELRSVAVDLDDAAKEKRDLASKHGVLLISQEQNRVRLSKMTKQLELYKQQQSDHEEAQQRSTQLQEEARLLRDKFLAVSEKERSLRQQLHSSTEAATTKLHAAEEALSMSQRQRCALEDRLRRTQEDLKALQKESVLLRRQAEEAHAAEAVLEATQAQLRETERHAFNFQSALDTLKAEQQSQMRAVEDRHAEELSALRRAHAEEMQRASSQAQMAVEEVETTLQHAQEAHAKEKAALQRELQEWVGEVEKGKQQVAAEQHRLDSERAARELLESQYRQEASVMRSVLEQSRAEAQRGPQMAELQLQLAAVSQRSELLEEACRRSAGVIAQLREALHREQITCRTLRQRDLNTSHHSK